MVLPTPFSTSAPAIASFNFSDLASGTGYETNFGIDVEGGTKFIVVSAVSSTAGNTSRGIDGTTEVNFDLTYGLPRRVNGTLFVSVTYAVDNSGGTGTSSCSVKVRPIHVALDNTETELASQQTASTLNASEGVDAAFRTTFAFTSIDRAFSKGEKIRFEIILDTDVGSGGTRNTFFFHDGDGRALNDISPGLPTSITEKSTLIFNIPYEVQV